jgi:hypothetical protein
MKTAEEKIKLQYINHLKKLMSGKTQKEKEAMIVGEKYIIKGHLAQVEDQIIEIRKRVDVINNFSITLDGKLAYDGEVCEEPAQ